MLRAVSTYLYVKERLHPGILDGLARSGVQAIEIFAARQHLDYANRKAHVKEIAEWFRGSGDSAEFRALAALCRLRMGTRRSAADQHRVHGPRGTG